MTPEPLPNLGIGKRLAFSLLPAILLLAALEIVLRVTGAAKECDGAFTKSALWACDPILDFKTRTTLKIGGKPVDADGFRGPPLDPAARYTVMAMGDSTTFGEITSSTEHPGMFISEPYPERLQTIAVNRNGPGALSVFNAGQCGYNSYHGLLLLKTKLRSLRPNIVTVKYGWNDLLYSNEPPGSYREPSSAVVREVQDFLLLTAIYPFGKKLAKDFQGARQSEAAAALKLPTPRDDWTPNVPLLDFDHNLRRIVEIARGRGAVVWLLTSGDAFMTDDFRGREEAYDHVASQQGMTIALGGIKSFRQLEELHARYNDTIRTVGADLGVPVVDIAERVYRRRAAEHLFTSFDAIHPNETGHSLEAEALYLQLKNAGIVGPGTRWGVGGRPTQR